MKTGLKEFNDWLEQMPFEEWKKGETGFRISLDKSRSLLADEQAQKPTADKDSCNKCIHADNQHTDDSDYCEQCARLTRTDYYTFEDKKDGE